MSRSAYAAYLANHSSDSNSEDEVPLYHFAAVKSDSHSSSTARDKPLQAAVRSFLSASGLSALIKSINQLQLGLNGNESGSGSIGSIPGRLQLFRGPHLSGAPMHNHGPAFNLLLPSISTVSKLWQLRPPGNDRYSAAHPLRAWRQEEVSGNGSCLVRQLPGQVLFVPRHASHMVLNLIDEELGVVSGFAWELDDYIY